jgi:hypothetical protein
VEATRAAWDRGIEVYIAIGVSRTSATTCRAIRDVFVAAGMAVPFLVESPLIPFGRAEEGRLKDDLVLQSVDRFAGPCLSLAEHPTIHSNGAITGCAVVFGRECAPLTFGRVGADPLALALDRMDADPLVAWIREVGVVEMKRHLEASTSIRFAERYVNICHLCGEILRNPEAVSALRQAFPPNRGPDATVSESPA